MKAIRTLADIKKANEEFQAKKAAEAPKAEPVVKQPKRRKHLVVPEEESPVQEEAPAAEEPAPAEEE